MRIAVFGMGYVGVVASACLAEMGHDVVGVDINPEKVATINEGRSPIVEERIGDLIAAMRSTGRLRATTDAADAVASSDVAFVCVGTPSAPSGALGTEYLERVAEEIGALLPRDRRYVVVIRSTVLPGTCAGVVVPQLEKASGLRAGPDFAVCAHPEFLREGSSVRDFYDPPKTVVGSDDADAVELVLSIYEGIPGPVVRTDLAVAEMVKYVDNSFHALKIAFANEIGAICRSRSVDARAVMDIFKQDTKLNISAAYLSPGMAFGGSCLPKDVRALSHLARHADIATPVLGNLLPSNDAHLDRAYELVAAAAAGGRRIGLLGLAFKPGTDDLRESPMVHLAERLIGRGHDVVIYDPEVKESTLLGANLAYVEAHLPHLSKLLADSLDDVVAGTEVLVVGTRRPELEALGGRIQDHAVVDLVGSSSLGDSAASYAGLCW
jgi:GDP-mannose 6-dehydrogenase